MILNNNPLNQQEEDEQNQSLFTLTTFKRSLTEAIRRTSILVSPLLNNALTPTI